MNVPTKIEGDDNGGALHALRVRDRYLIEPTGKVDLPKHSVSTASAR